MLSVDEVGALVVDIGTHTTRAGYAGEDMPKVDFPSYVGIVEEFAENIEAMDTSTVIQEVNNSTDVNSMKPSDQNRVNRRYLLDPLSYRTPRPNMNVQSFLKDGLVNDWDLFEKALDFTFIKYLRCDPAQHPILFTEPVVSIPSDFKPLVTGVVTISCPHRPTANKNEKKCVKSCLRSSRRPDSIWPRTGFCQRTGLKSSFHTNISNLIRF